MNYKIVKKYDQSIRIDKAILEYISELIFGYFNKDTIDKKTIRVEFEDGTSISDSEIDNIIHFIMKSDYKIKNITITVRAFENKICSELEFEIENRSYWKGLTLTYSGYNPITDQLLATIESRINKNKTWYSYIYKLNSIYFMLFASIITTLVYLLSIGIYSAKDIILLSLSSFNAFIFTHWIIKWLQVSFPKYNFAFHKEEKFKNIKNVFIYIVIPIILSIVGAAIYDKIK